MQKTRNISKIIFLLISPVVFLLFFNTAYNMHQHILPNGQIIEHAHPYHSDSSSTPFQHHHHSHNQFTFLSLIYNPLSLTLFFVVLISVSVLPRQKEHNSFLISLSSEESVRYYAGRAPPNL